jgi:hypothetical protein
LAELETRVRQLEAEQTPAAPERPLEAKERDSLLKSVIGMALDSYKYEPKLSRSTVPQQIADDLAKHGLVLDVDTVRKWLKLGAEFLPPQ